MNIHPYLDVITKSKVLIFPPSIELPFPHSDGGCGMMRVPHSDLHSNKPDLLI